MGKPARKQSAERIPVKHCEDWQLEGSCGESEWKLMHLCVDRGAADSTGQCGGDRASNLGTTGVYSQGPCFHKESVLRNRIYRGGGYVILWGGCDVHDPGKKWTKSLRWMDLAGRDEKGGVKCCSL